MTLQENMYLAWQEKAERAFAEERAAVEAPALFKPEWSARASADLRKALAEMRRWST